MCMLDKDCVYTTSNDDQIDFFCQYTHGQDFGDVCEVDVLKEYFRQNTVRQERHEVKII